MPFVTMFAGAFLTFSTAAGAIGADLLIALFLVLAISFPFVFAWGLVYIVFFKC